MTITCLSFLSTTPIPPQPSIIIMIIININLIINEVFILRLCVGFAF